MHNRVGVGFQGQIKQVPKQSIADLDIKAKKHFHGAGPGAIKRSGQNRRLFRSIPLGLLEPLVMRSPSAKGVKLEHLY